MIRTKKGELSIELAKPMARVAFLMFRLAANVLDEQLADPGADKQYVKLITLGDTMLRWVLEEELKMPGEELPKKAELEAAILKEDWGKVKKQAGQWQQVLTAPPLSLEPPQLR